MEKTNDKTQKEICVTCGLNTHIDKNTDVNYRVFYVEGAGQLCQECYTNIFNFKLNNNDDVPVEF